MKTIAITIDESMLKSLDRLAGTGARKRSELVRLAVGQYLARVEKGRREAAERSIWEKKYDRVNRQTRSQLAEQADL